jgi:hypothetical protein
VAARRPGRAAAGAVVAALVILLAPFTAVRPAAADGVDPSADVQLAQTVAGNELTVIIRRTRDVPGPLYVEVIAHRPAPVLTLALTVHSALDNRTASASLRIDGRAGAYAAAPMRVHDVGAHSLELRAAGEVSVLPFFVVRPRIAGWEVFVYGGFGTVGLLLLGATLAAGRGRRVPAVALGGLAVLLLVAAGTVAVVSPGFPPATPDGLPPQPPAGAGGPVPTGRAYPTAILDTTPATPTAGTGFVLHLALADGTTGWPVDDLVPYHSALMHLVVTSQDGAFFAHVHPRRTAAGQYEVQLRVDRPGHYLASAEIARADGGGRLVSGAFDVRGDPAAPAAPAAAPPTVAAVQQPAVAGAATTLRFDTGHADLQPWLGMAGHLIVRDASGAVFGHVHELGSAAAPAGRQQVPDETVAGFGPVLTFVYTFPKAGRWLVWLQYARDFGIETTPYVVDVADAGAG